MEDIKQKVPFYGGYTKIYADNEYFEVLQTENPYKTYFGWYTKVKFQKLRTETGVKYVHAVAEVRSWGTQKNVSLSDSSCYLFADRNLNQVSEDDFKDTKIQEKVFSDLKSVCINHTQNDVCKFSTSLKVPEEVFNLEQALFPPFL